MKKFCLQNIYSRLSDEESRFLFKERLHYALTGDRRQMINAISEKRFSSMNEKRGYYEELLGSRKKCFLFGSGASSRGAFFGLSNICWQAFIDNDYSKIGRPDILPVISFQEFIENSENAVVFIASPLYGTEMRQQLINSGFSKDFIIDFYLAFAQYFDLPYLKPQKNEFFIDVGGFDGSSTRDFFRWIHNIGEGGERDDKSIIFEPNLELSNICKENLQKWKCHNVKIVNKALWHKKETLKFHVEKGKKDNSRINSDGEEIIETISLDDYLKDEKEPVTFIKMDIEGAELNALKGAEKTIRELKPKLAICIYHKPEDIWEIPSLLLDYVPDYKFYIRHYNFSANETVLYALQD